MRPVIQLSRLCILVLGCTLFCSLQAKEEKQNEKEKKKQPADKHQPYTLEKHNALVNPTAKPIEKAVSPKVDKNELLGHIKYLASPELRGREAGTVDQILAAKYIADNFERFGLKPFGDPDEKDKSKKTWFQEFSLSRSGGMGKGNRLKLTVPADTKIQAPAPTKENPAPAAPKGPDVTFKAGEQFAPFPASDNPKHSASGEVAFVGYAISAPEYEYNDFQNVDLAGKWALVLRYEPQEKDKDSVFQGTRHTRHAGLTSKIQNCLMNRAVGVLVVTGPQDRGDEKEELTKSRGGLMGDFDAPVFQIKREVANAILAPSGKTLGELQAAIDKDLKPQSFQIKGAKLEGTSHLKVDPRPTYNIIGMIEGTDPKLKDEYVVLGAHADHVGMGSEGSLWGKRGRGKMHPGADDNASGTSGLLEIAQAIGALKGEARPKRSILFMAFSGEEKGLIGSRHWVNKPSIPLKKIVSMLNLDMIGRSNNGAVQIAGMGTAEEFRKMVLKYANEDKRLNASLSNGGRAPSDNTSFFEKNIPVMFFFTGTHPDYHRPTDTWEKINAPVAEAIADLARKLALDIANMPQRPKFTKPKARGYIGISVDREALRTAKGFPVGTVKAESPAEKAGMQVGDLIVGLNGRDIGSARDLMQGLTSYTVGDAVDLVVERGEEKIKMSITLGKR